MTGFWQRTVRAPLLALLLHGVTPSRLALSVAIGITVGLIPVWGISTVLCAAIALLLRLNFAAMQLAQALVAPLQLLLIIPFVRVGEWIMNAPAQPITVAAGVSLLNRGMWHAIVVLRAAILHASIAWIVVAPIAIFGLYTAITPVFARVAARASARRAMTARMKTGSK